MLTLADNLRHLPTDPHLAASTHKLLEQLYWAVPGLRDPERNRLKWGRDRASLARPEYDPWWRCWEEEDWVSLGRARNFDWMHVQAAKVS